MQKDRISDLQRSVSCEISLSIHSDMIKRVQQGKE